MSDPLAADNQMGFCGSPDHVWYLCCLPGRGGASVRGRGSTPPSRGAPTAAAKTTTGGARGRTSPTKPAGAPARGAARGGSRAPAGRTTPGGRTTPAGRTTGILCCYLYSCFAYHSLTHSSSSCRVAHKALSIFKEITFCNLVDWSVCITSGFHCTEWQQVL